MYPSTHDCKSKYSSTPSKYNNILLTTKFLIHNACNTYFNLNILLWPLWPYVYNFTNVILHLLSYRDFRNLRNFRRVLYLSMYKLIKIECFILYNETPWGGICSFKKVRQSSSLNRMSTFSCSQMYNEI